MNHTGGSRSVILVLTNPADAPADRVVQELRSRGCAVYRFDIAELPQRATITIGAGKNQALPQIYRDWAPGVLLPDVGCVWYRKPGAFVVPEYSQPYKQRFARSELSMAFGGMLRALECYWMSPPGAIAEARFKVEQLARAERLGLSVPDSCVTSQPSHAAAFIREHHSNVVIKALGDPDIYAPREGVAPVTNIRTSRVTSTDLNSINRVTEAPVLLQEEIHKQADIRATVVGGSVIPVLIESQSRPESSLDWRSAATELPHEVMTLPRDVESRLIALADSYGLRFAAIDLANSVDGDYVFLELNPNGEWGWLDDLAGADIGSRIADELESAACGVRDRRVGVKS